MTGGESAIRNGFFYNNWYVGISPEKGRALAEVGEAICVGDFHHVIGLPGNDPVYVNQHVARSLAETIETIDSYRSLGSRYGTSVFFRGQNRDYIDGGCLTVDPVALRTEPWKSAYPQLGRTVIDEQFGPWAKVIDRELKVDAGTGLYYWFSDPAQPGKTSAGAFVDRRTAARIGTNPLLMAIAMHYGFPTLCLDVSSDADVSIWFALHQADRNASGQIAFAPMPDDTHRLDAPVDALASQPSLYIYLQKHDRDNPVIDLTHIEALRGTAERPFVQSAVALPYRTFGMFASAGMDSGFVRSEGPAFRYPTAVVKLLFQAGEIRTARPEIDGDYLFPKSDRLYQALLNEQASELAIYA